MAVDTPQVERATPAADRGTERGSERSSTDSSHKLLACSNDSVTPAAAKRDNVVDEHGYLVMASPYPDSAGACAADGTKGAATDGAKTVLADGAKPTVADGARVNPSDAANPQAAALPGGDATAAAASPTDGSSGGSWYSGLVSKAENFGSSVVSGAESLGSSVVSGAENLGSQVVSGAENLGSSILGGVENAGSSIVSGVENFGSSIAADVAPTLSAASNDLGSWLNSGASLVNNAGNDLGSMFSGIGTDLSSFGSDLSNIGSDLSNIGSDIGSDIGSFAGDAGNFVDNAWNNYLIGPNADSPSGVDPSGFSDGGDAASVNGYGTNTAASSSDYYSNSTDLSDPTVLAAAQAGLDPNVSPETADAVVQQATYQDTAPATTQVVGSLGSTAAQMAILANPEGHSASELLAAQQFVVDHAVAATDNVDSQVSAQFAVLGPAGAQAASGLTAKVNDVAGSIALNTYSKTSNALSLADSDDLSQAA